MATATVDVAVVRLLAPFGDMNIMRASKYNAVVQLIVIN
jgi:hypothetical protein